ncbi:Integrase zinc binding domain [Popillia japonica]|uniref:RNA-directed DNA polymerase n=2 Tax=Popillia japonica TaxID=7064 RepID=A0AAW1KN35_POPJA
MSGFVTFQVPRLLTTNSWPTTDKDASRFICTIVTASKEKQEEIREDTMQDPILQQVKQYTLKGWPKYKKDLPTEVRPYWQVRHNIYIKDDLLFADTRLLVPQKQIRCMINTVHYSRQGINFCVNKAKKAYLWPGMTKQIREVIENCNICLRFMKANNKQPITPHPIPELPWQKIGMDFAYINKTDYLVMVDYYSKFVVLHSLHKKDARSSKTHLSSPRNTR